MSHHALRHGKRYNLKDSHEDERDRGCGWLCTKETLQIHLKRVWFTKYEFHFCYFERQVEILFVLFWFVQ